MAGSTEESRRLNGGPRVVHVELRPGVVELTPEESRHLHVLRVLPNSLITLIDGRGGIGAGIALDIPRRGNARVRIDRVQHEECPAACQIIVAAPKGDRLGWMIEKLTELGVSAITLTNFERSVVQVGPAHIERAQRTILETLKQCRSLWAPRVSAAPSLAAALQGHSQGALAGPVARICYAHPDPQAITLTQWLSAATPAAATSILIGPEGGITDAEAHQIEAAGGARVRLAPNILRIETAALAAAACCAATRD